MWVRIREISFPADQTDEVVSHVRDTVVSRSAGEGFRGYRLLVDRPNGAALEVSYWETEEDVRSTPHPTTGSAQADGQAVNPTGVDGGAVVATNYYELGIDAG